MKAKAAEHRIALIGVIIEDMAAAGELNAALHQYGDYIIGRFGLPYHKRGLHILSIAIDAPQDIINALSGRIGRLPGVSAKTAYSSLAAKS